MSLAEHEYGHSVECRVDLGYAKKTFLHATGIFDKILTTKKNGSEFLTTKILTTKKMVVSLKQFSF